MNTNLIPKIKSFLFKKRAAALLSLNKFLRFFKLKVLFVKEAEIKHKLVENMFALLDDNNSLMSVVFSKDRAMQLHAFLKSYFENVANYSPIFILYKASDDRHKASYLTLETEFKSKGAYFIEELNFRKQLIELLQNEQYGKVIFFVDDMIVTHTLDFSVIKEVDTNNYILALSRGKDLTYSMVLEKTLVLPNFEKYNQELYSFDWNYTEEYSDWTFPLGVSGYMFGRKQMLAMLLSIDFKAPNTFEWALQVFIEHFITKKGLCTLHATCACVHANLVQTEGTSPDLGTFSVGELLDKWEEGKRIDVAEFYNVPLQIAEKKSYNFI